MAESPNPELSTFDTLFPANSRVLLTGTGRQFVERIGINTVRNVILGVLMGENIRSQTEPLTRQRIAQVSRKCGIDLERPAYRLAPIRSAQDEKTNLTDIVKGRNGLSVFDQRRKGRRASNLHCNAEHGNEHFQWQ